MVVDGSPTSPQGCWTPSLNCYTTVLFQGSRANMPHIVSYIIIFFNSGIKSSRSYLSSFHFTHESVKHLTQCHIVGSWEMEIPANFKASALSTAFSSLSFSDSIAFMEKQEEGRWILMDTVILNLIRQHKESGLWADVPQVLWAGKPRLSPQEGWGQGLGGWQYLRSEQETKLPSKAWLSLWRQIIHHLSSSKACAYGAGLSDWGWGGRQGKTY